MEGSQEEPQSSDESLDYPGPSSKEILRPVLHKKAEDYEEGIQPPENTVMPYFI